MTLRSQPLLTFYVSTKNYIYVIIYTFYHSIVPIYLCVRSKSKLNYNKNIIQQYLETDKDIQIILE